MRIINIVDNVTKVNFGIWNAAISTTQALYEEHGVISELWGPPSDDLPPVSPYYTYVPTPNLAVTAMDELIKFRNLDPKNDLIVSHGCWKHATRWGHAFSQKGFAWLALPHGMLMAWAFGRKAWKKNLYFYLVEQRLLSKATMIRAVSKLELAELVPFFPKNNLVALENCITMPAQVAEKSKHVWGFLFMARINEVKGVVPLAKAWSRSNLMNNPKFELRIAGPDHGALDELQQFLATLTKPHNIEYIGSRYGDDKLAELQRAAFYALPSQGEGFATSVIEAISFGMVPLITSGCNFPEVIDADIALEITPDEEQILAGLNRVAAMSDSERQDRADRGIAMMRQSYSDSSIAKQQLALYNGMF
jgi:glycosyltransferase involved in cell wall biosynthesis